MRKLTRGQISTLDGLDAEKFYMLGCSEPAAIRLCKPAFNRPALVREGPKNSEGYRTFALTEAGVEALDNA
jgi:hypothetical protein